MGEIIITLVVVGLLFLLMRKGGIGCCGGHSHGHHSDSHNDHHRQKDRNQKSCH